MLVGVEERRALAVEGLGLGPRSDEGVQVAGLELVGLLGEDGQVGHAVLAHAGGERVVEGERGQRGEAPGAAAPDGHAGRVDVAPFGQVLGRRDAVLDVDHPPLALQQVPVGPAVAGGAAVVDVDHGEPPAGPELDAELELAPGRAGRPAVDVDQQRRLLPVRPHVVRVRRRVVEGVGGPSTGAREVDRLSGRLICSGLSPRSRGGRITCRSSGGPATIAASLVKVAATAAMPPGAGTSEERAVYGVAMSIGRCASSTRTRWSMPSRLTTATPRAGSVGSFSSATNRDIRNTHDGVATSPPDSSGDGLEAAAVPAGRARRSGHRRRLVERGVRTFVGSRDHPGSGRRRW